MPIYEYQCESCGEVQEFIQKMSDAPLRDCPLCGERALKKRVSAAGFRLGGTGWYETDFKTDGKRNLADSDRKKSKNEKNRSAKEKPKTDTTPSAKTNTSPG